VPTVSHDFLRISLMLYYGIQGAAAKARSGTQPPVLTKESLERTYTMRNNVKNKTLLSALVALAALCLGSLLAPAHNQSNPAADAKSQACPNDDSGLKLPPGFCATIFADGIGHARHMVVAPSGILYVNTWSGRYYGNDTPHAGGFLVALQDKSGAGKADAIERFGETVQTGGAGGTGIGMYKGSIYAEINDHRCRISSGRRVPGFGAQESSGNEHQCKRPGL
jgi:hypothetical protein